MDSSTGQMLVGSLPAVGAYVRRRVANRDTADDILQEVSLRALASAGPRDPSSFVSWLRGIARNVIGLESRRLRRGEQPTEPSLLDRIRDPLATPERLCDARASLERAINADRERVTLLLRRLLDNVSGNDLARQLGLSPAALRMRLTRVRSLVRAQRFAAGRPQVR